MMNKITWVERDDLFSSAISKFLPADVLVDIGCGIMPQNHIVPSVHICVEPHLEYVQILQKKIEQSYDRSYVILNTTWNGALRILPPKSVDTVILADVVEHLEKDKAISLLESTINLARRQIIIFTPLGYLPQTHPDGIDAWGLSGGEWQEHKSGWSPDDFSDEWQIVCAKEYYYQDNIGKPFESPYGAFWAIKTVSSEADCQRAIFRSYISKLFNIVRSINDPSILRVPTFFLEYYVSLLLLSERVIKYLKRKLLKA